MKDVRLTHIGGPTVLIEVDGWRLLTDPTFDPPGRRYHFGWGTVSRKLAGPAIPAADLGRIDAVLLSHDHHDDNLDAAGRRCCRRPGRSSRRPPAPSGSAVAARARAVGEDPPGGAGRPAIEVTATPCRHDPP